MKKTKFENQLIAALNEQADTLPNQTRLHLRSAREIALTKQAKRRGFPVKWLGGAAAGVALASLMSFVITPKLMPSDSISPLDDLEILTADADLELLTQMDFYQWIDESDLSKTAL